MSSRSRRPSDVTSSRATANGFTHPTKHLGTQELLRAGVYREQPIDALLPQFVHHGVELFFGRDVAHARADESLPAFRKGLGKFGLQIPELEVAVLHPTLTAVPPRPKNHGATYRHLERDPPVPLPT